MILTELSSPVETTPVPMVDLITGLDVDDSIVRQVKGTERVGAKVGDGRTVDRKAVEGIWMMRYTEEEEKEEEEGETSGGVCMLLKAHVQRPG